MGFDTGRSASPPFSPAAAAAAGAASSSSASAAPIASHSLASFSSSLLLFCSAILSALLNQHFLEQHVHHLGRRGCRIDARQQLLAQAIDAAGAAQILDPKLAQIDLKIIDDAGHDCLQPRQILRALELEAHRQLEEARL